MQSQKSWIKNSIPLFFRMGITMGITLYTARIVLYVLGVEDFGIYNVVGGIVILFTFLNSAMSAATQRFLSYDIGRKDQKSLQSTFYSVMMIHFFVGVLVVVLCETIGLWYLYKKMNFTFDRFDEVKFVFHLSVFSVFVTVIQVPLNSLIIAFEKMKVFAYLGFVEAALKLLVVLLLTTISFDKLKLYSVLTTISVVVVFCFYTIYCYFYIIKSWTPLSLKLNKTNFKVLLSYSGWNLFGNLAAMGRMQGNNLLLNYFYGPKVNASYSLSLQVQNAVNLFVNNIQLALSPQIIKKYAQGLIEDTVHLIFQGARYCYFVMFIVILPIYFNVEYLLDVWLVYVPEHAVSFTKLSLILILIDSLSGPLMTGIQATGKIKGYQTVVGVLLLLNLPLSYFGLLIFKQTPEIVFNASIVISISALCMRIYFLESTLQRRVMREVRKLLFKVGLSGIVAVILYFVFKNLISERSVWQVIVFNLSLVFIVTVSVVFIGSTKAERDKIYKFIKTHIDG